MTLIPGTRLGAFDIIALVGAGGMGEVYRARDTRLGRDVALKVLPDLFAQDADRLSRFQREAQLLACLNHPNIAAIHGLEDAGGVRALVLELVHGETLADRLQRGPMPVAEVVTAARQIADALEAAHEQGVIHRDLKPANVKISPDGNIKVLDFGLAKALESVPAASQLTHSPTLSLAGTFAGVILGTAAYMSPEQAKGLPADQRSDVFSFGCVVFEMLTGRQAFQADTATEMLAAVLMREPDLQTLPTEIHPRLADLVRRCLDKNPRRRWQAIGDVRFELDAIAADPGGPANRSGTTPTPVTTRSRLSNVAWLIATAAVVATVAIAGTRWTTKAADAPLVARFSIALPEDQSALRLTAPTLALSPDGTKLVYAANRQLFVRSMSDMTARPISGTALDVTSPFFSPDGQWVGFFAFQDLTIKKIAVTGGAALTVCKAEPIAGADWQGDHIVFAQPIKGIMRVSANGGEPETIAQIANDEAAFGPRLIDRGTAVLYTVSKAGLGFDRWDRAQIVVERIGSRQRTVVVRGGSDARYLPTGHIVYALASSVLAIPFDLKTNETKGGPVPVVESVMRVPNSATQVGIGHFATSATGALVYIPGIANGQGGARLLSLVERDGKTQPIALPPQMYVHPRLSPDGTQIAVGTDDGRDSNVWVYDRKAPGASLRRLTFGGHNLYPIWSPDGRYIAFQSDREGDGAIFRQLANGSGAAERLTKPDPGTQHEPESWSPDGKTLSFNNISGANQGVWTVGLSGDRKPVMFADSTENTVEKHSVFSPNGRWMAYMAAPVSTIAVNTEVFVQPFPLSGAKYQLSSGGGRTPRWSPDGKQLFYHEPATNRLFVVDVRTEPAVSFGRPIALPIEGTIHPLAQRNYDVTSDGRQLLVVVSATPRTAESGRVAQQINVVLNWFEELKARVPVTR
jgi:eukaryotic-like serine/threonine-protein kinase